MSISETIRALPAYKHWKDEPWEALLAAGTTEERFPGSRILTARRVDRLGLLLSGRVGVSLPTSYGPLKIGTAEAGVLFGAEAYLDSRPRVTDLEVEEDCSILVYNRPAIDSLAVKQGFRAAWLWTCWRSLSETLRSRNALLPRFFGEHGPESIREAPQIATPQPARVALDDKRLIFEEKRLSGMVIQFLTTLSREERYEGGESIFREGDPADKMYVVAEGEVMISRRLPGAGQEAITFLKRGDFFGEMGLIDQQNRTADASARGGSAVLLAISRDVLGGVLDIEKVSSLRLLDILCGVMAQRVRATEEKLTSWFVLSGGQIADAEPS